MSKKVGPYIVDTLIAVNKSNKEVEELEKEWQDAKNRLRIAKDVLEENMSKLHEQMKEEKELVVKLKSGLYGIRTLGECVIVDPIHINIEEK